MNRKEIIFSTERTFLGRNGTFIAKGLVIYGVTGGDKTISISPITSKDETGRCEINLPEADLQKFIDELQSLIKK